jgi:hypothetical protein
MPCDIVHSTLRFQMYPIYATVHSTYEVTGSVKKSTAVHCPWSESAPRRIDTSSNVEMNFIGILMCRSKVTKSGRWNRDEQVPTLLAKKRENRIISWIWLEKGEQRRLPRSLEVKLAQWMRNWSLTNSFNCSIGELISNSTYIIVKSLYIRCDGICGDHESSSEFCI